MTPEQEARIRDAVQRCTLGAISVSDLTSLLAEVDRLREENADLKSDVIAFCAPWAVTYARDRGLPEGHLASGHYDILERCGARMVDFVREPKGESNG